MELIQKCSPQLWKNLQFVWKVLLEKDSKLNTTLSSPLLSKPVLNLLPVMAQKHQWGSAELKVDANEA